ncbi:MAG: hypothetical protein ACE5FT_04820 [Candidatus Nanoarchaeia archaeon]
MAELEIDELEKKIKQDGGLTLESAVRASILYARRGSEAYLRIFAQYKPIRTFSEQDLKQIDANIQVGNALWTKKKAEVDEIVELGNSVRSQYTTHKWENTDVYFKIPQVPYLGKVIPIELHKELTPDRDQDGILELARGAKPDEARPGPADLLYAIKTTLYDNLGNEEANGVPEAAIEWLRNTYANLMSRRVWGRTTSETLWVPQSNPQIPDSLLHNVGMTEDSMFGSERRIQIDLAGSRNNLSTLGTSADSVCEAATGLTASRLDTINQEITGRPTWLGRFEQRERPSETTRRAVGFGVGGIGNFGVLLRGSLVDARPALRVRRA